MVAIVTISVLVIINAVILQVYLKVYENITGVLLLKVNRWMNRRID